MSDSARLVPFRTSQPPVIPNGDRQYFSEADSRIETSIRSIQDVIKLLEARLVAGGL
jgi:hypothetical protein